MLTISRDNEFITTVNDEFELLRWFHRKHSYSIDHAVRYEGYIITDSNGIAVSV